MANSCGYWVERSEWRGPKLRALPCLVGVCSILQRKALLDGNAHLSPKPPHRKPLAENEAHSAARRNRRPMQNLGRARLPNLVEPCRFPQKTCTFEHFGAR